MHLITILALLLQTTTPAPELSDRQIRDAIEMGRAGNVPIVQVGAWLGVSKGDFDVFIEGPIARIAAAASNAFRQYRPFDETNVTPAMREPVYRVRFRRDFDRLRDRTGPLGDVQHVVLQPRRAKGMEGVIQPVREDVGNGEAFFDRFPDGEFDVVIATQHEVQKCNVSSKQRAKIQ